MPLLYLLVAAQPVRYRNVTVYRPSKTGGQDYMRQDCKTVTRAQLIRAFAGYNGQVVVVERWPEQVVHIGGGGEVPVEAASIVDIEDVEIFDGAQFAAVVDDMDPMEKLTKALARLTEDVGVCYYYGCKLLLACYHVADGDGALPNQ